MSNKLLMEQVYSTKILFLINYSLQKIPEEKKQNRVCQNVLQFANWLQHY